MGGEGNEREREREKEGGGDGGRRMDNKVEVEAPSSSSAHHQIASQPDAGTTLGATFFFHNDPRGGHPIIRLQARQSASDQNGHYAGHTTRRVRGGIALRNARDMMKNQVEVCRTPALRGTPGPISSILVISDTHHSQIEDKKISDSRLR